MDERNGFQPAADSDGRPGLAMIANCITPYRAHLHAVLAAGIPELKLHTLITHGPAEFDWSVNVPSSIHASYFSYGKESPFIKPYQAPLKEWRKGGQLIDYLHAHDVRAVICAGYQYLSYQRVIRHCHRVGLPLFAHNDSNILSERRLSPFKKWVKRRIYSLWLPQVSGAMPMGELGDQFFLKYGVSPARLYRLPCTPDYDLYSHVESQQLEQFCRKFRLSDTRRYLLYSGRLVPVKRVDLLLDAFAAIASERPEWNLLLVGDGRLRDELQSRVPEDLRGRVTWTGFLEQSECVAAYHAADVLVLPSDHEPWALVIQEAMAAGLAVVASDVVGAAHDLVQDQSSGRIFPAGNVGELTRALFDVTDENHLESYQEQSQRALAEWRHRVDPVQEVRRALTDVHVLPLAAG